MSDEEQGEGDSMEELTARHRKEKKELQGHIQHLKKHINKDKKKKKEVTEEIQRLETELKERHASELAALQTSQDTEPVAAVSDGVSAVSLNDTTEDQEEESQPPIGQQGKKISKAEKRRQKKAEANREREARIKEAEASNKHSARSVEAAKLKSLLRERSLKMHEIQPDGNCYCPSVGGDSTIASLRTQASQYIRDHYDDFSPFITDPNTGDLLTPEQFSDYCDRVESTPLWGGQPELRALSLATKKRIEVLQAEGSPIVFGENFKDEKGIVLTYYRHYYGLGEHYNSTMPLSRQSDEAQEEEES